VLEVLRFFQIFTGLRQFKAECASLSLFRSTLKWLIILYTSNNVAQPSVGLQKNSPLYHSQKHTEHK